MNDFWFGVIVGIVAGIFGLCVIATVSESDQTRLCKLQDWKGEVCQCRLTTGIDKR